MAKIAKKRENVEGYVEKKSNGNYACTMECLNQESLIYCCIGSAKNKPVTAWPL